MSDGLMELACEIQSQARRDPEFRQRLCDNPVASLEEMGATLREGVELRLFQDTESVRHWVIPAAHPRDSVARGASRIRRSQAKCT